MPGLGMCCCCNDIYHWGSALASRVRLSGDPPDNTVSKVPATPVDAARLDFDPVNKLLFGVFAGAITKYNSSLASQGVILTLPSNLHFSSTQPSCDVDNQRVYYTVSDDNEPDVKIRFIRRVNYDGSGDTLVASFSMAPNGSGASVPLLIVARSAQKLVISWKNATNFGTEIRTYNMDGSGESTIFSGSTSPDSTVRGQEWDGVNDKLWFLYNLVGSGIEVRRCDIDGGNMETRYTGPTSGPSAIFGIQFSHKLNQVFWHQWDNSATVEETDEGVFYMDYASTTPQLLITSFDLALNSNSFTDMRLGCGFEKTGPSSLG